MTEPTDIETVYEVYHPAQYGFSGNTSILVAVAEETDDQIIGHRTVYGAGDYSVDQIVLQKENLVGWQTKNDVLEDLTESDNETFPPCPECGGTFMCHTCGNIEIE